MDDQSNNESASIKKASPVDASKEKRGHEKVDGETFLVTWRGTLALGKDPVTKLRSMINAGFTGEIIGNHVSQIASVVLEARGYPCIAERLALGLAVQERYAKLKPLAQRILAALRTSFAEALDYDPQEFVGVRAPRAIEEWVAGHAPKTPSPELDTWLRRFMTCLLKDTEPKTLLSGLIATARVGAPVKRRAGNQEAAFVRGVVAALTSPVIAKNRLELILSGTSSVEAQFQEMLSREVSLERQIRSQQGSIEELEEKVKSLHETLVEARSDGDRKASRITELEQSITEATQRHDLLDRHWRGVSEQQLAIQSGSFREKIHHELQEAMLALDRQQPNVEMALQRLRRIREILEK